MAFSCHAVDGWHYLPRVPPIFATRNPLMSGAGDAKAYIAARIAVEDRGYSSPCWIWQKALTEKGYGRAHIPGFSGMPRVHRATYELYVSAIPDGLTIDHLCRVKACCNPEHLEAVPALENFRRALPFIPAKTHCVRGHPLTPETKGSSGCRVCHAIRQREYSLRKRAA
jgi:hypothetical protein